MENIDEARSSEAEKDSAEEVKEHTHIARRWWQSPELLASLREVAEELVIDDSISAHQDREIFSTIIKTWGRVTGTRPLYSQGSLYLYDAGVGVWANCPSPRSPATGAASYRLLWDLMGGIKTVHLKLSRGKETPVFISIGPTQERRMDDEPSRTHSIHQPEVFDYETPGLVLPTRVNGRVEWRLWRPKEDGSVVHAPPCSQDYKRHFWWDEALGDAQIIDGDAEQPEIPLWEDYLTSFWGDDSEAIDKKSSLEEFLGASLCGIATLFQRFAIFEGSTGSNGKSLLCKFIARYLFQRDQTAASPPEQWGPDGFGTFQLDNKLINLITEIPEGKALRSDRLKAIISGDEVSANRKNLPHVVLKPRAGHIISCNKTPRLGDSSGGMLRRVLLFKFNRQFKGAARRSERELLSELHKVVPQIRLRCLFAAADLMRRKDYTLSAEHGREMVELQERSSPAAAFIRVCLDTVEDTLPGIKPSTDQSAVFKAYVDYCDATGVTYQLTDREFYKEMENSGLRRTEPSRTHRKFLNIKIRDRSEWDVPAEDFRSRF